MALPTAQTIADLQKQVETLTGEKADFSAKITALTADKEAAEKLASEAQENVTKLTGEKEQLSKEVGEHKAKAYEAVKLKGEAESAKIKAEQDRDNALSIKERELREISARNGGTLPPKDMKAGDFTGGNKANEVSRESFSKLSAREQLAHVNSGGKVTD